MSVVWRKCVFYFISVAVCTYILAVMFQLSENVRLRAVSSLREEKLSLAQSTLLNTHRQNLVTVATHRKEKVATAHNMLGPYIHRKGQKIKEVDVVIDNVNTCMKISNLSLDKILLSTAERNARLFFNTFRQVIPRNALKDYTSHCWQTDYNISMSEKRLTKRVIGHIDNVRFNYSGFQLRKRAREDLLSHHKGKFSSSTVCLPNVYLLGVEKCGTTYLWCVISKLMNGVVNPYSYQVIKEPYFWTPLDYTNFAVNASQIGSSYLPNFIRTFDRKHTSQEQKKATVIDACPSTITEWPVFSQEDPTLANYCLYPSAFPSLFPHSKFIISVRNPVTLLYSAFWWSFKTATHHVPSDKEAVEAVVANHTQGPDLFHKHVMEKIDAFFHCMKDNSSEISDQCTLMMSTSKYNSCISKRVHLLSVCVHNITSHRQMSEAVLHRGIYVAHIRKWLSVIPRNRLLVIKFEEMIDRPIQIADAIHHFLNRDSDFKGLERRKIASVLQSCRTNENGINYKHDPDLQMRHDTKKLLEKFFYPFNVMLSELLNDPKFSVW